MITLWQSVLIGLVVVATQLDGQVLGECKLREPIVTGFLVGLILGDVTKGLIIGSQMQLMWMGATAIGPTAGLDVARAAPSASPWRCPPTPAWRAPSCSAFPSP